MDPNKSSGAPPPEFSGEKSSMGQAPPPPYYDNPNPGYPQPGPGYPPQPQGYPPPGQYMGAGYGQQPPPMGQQYGGQPTTITVQPTVLMTRTPLAHPVNDYLGYSIFTMLCCCLPLGIAALIFSIFTREANRVGDQAEAERSSRVARTLNHVALGIGIGIIILYIIYAVVLATR
ncbi:proline-rich transmembrane protein 1 [Anabas testudineus]|uniref:proline-rich transmembrane protein 1 n=1 Tax=Anabas testudineus TaxID=64144 RepID=UPI000E465068|nr:proline-rich transmembrane protein 1 [Anabas testudineus]